MEEDLGREPAQMPEDTAEALKDMKEELAEERAEQRQERQSLNFSGLSTAIFSTLAVTPQAEEKEKLEFPGKQV